MHRLLLVVPLASLVGCTFLLGGNGRRGQRPEARECDTFRTAFDTACGHGTCTNSMVSGSEFPTLGTPDAYYRTSFEARLNDFEAGASLTVATGGQLVPGTSSVDGKRVIFAPTAPLQPATTYEVSLDFSCANPRWQVTTSDVGAPVAADGLVGNTYSLELTSGRFVEPEGIGPLLQEYLTDAVLLDVLATDGGSIELAGAIEGEDGSCVRSIDFPTADFGDNPYFQVGPETTTLAFEGVDIEVDDLLVSGAFSPDGSAIEGAQLRGTIDTRPLVPLLNEEGAEDEICNLAATIGVSCKPCPDGGVFCLDLHVDSIPGLGVDVECVDP